MAARTRKGTKDSPWAEATRERIQGAMLINRVQDHALGKLKMSSSQLTAALGLLRKVLPDLTSQDLNIKGGLEMAIIGLVQGLDNAKPEDEEAHTLQ